MYYHETHGYRARSEGGCTAGVSILQDQSSVSADEINRGPHARARQKARTCAWGRACGSAIGMMEPGRRRSRRPSRIKQAANPSKRHGETEKLAAAAVCLRARGRRGLQATTASPGSPRSPWPPLNTPSLSLHGLSQESERPRQISSSRYEQTNCTLRFSPSRVNYSAPIRMLSPAHTSTCRSAQPVRDAEARTPWPASRTVLSEY